MKKYLKIIPIVVIVAALAVFAIIKFYDPYRVDLTSGDKHSIAQTVNDYYNALQLQDYSKALSYCEINGNNNYIHMDTETRILCLQELRKNIITMFKYDSLLKGGSDGSVIISYDCKVRAYFVSATYELSMKNSGKAAVEEIVYLRKINSKWEITRLMSADRYVGYRVGSYRYIINNRLTANN